jgi:catechol 2,3-dioxygenase-like lactoylglutathione lyase family enzyme
MRGIFHLNVSDTAAHRAFWVDTLGGTLAPAGAVAFPKAEMRLLSRKPSGGTKGTAVNHIAFGVPDIREAVDRTRAAGFSIVTREELPERIEVKDGLAFIPPLKTSVAFTFGPDEVKVEFLQVPGEPIAFHHVHFFSPDPGTLKLWYAKLFNVEPVVGGVFQSIDLPNGFNLTFSPSDSVQPTTGRAIDRIEFELENASALVERRLTDPWGTSIEIRGLGPL